jgi:U6 snRNA-associated Sm-like protein LSm2
MCQWGRGGDPLPLPVATERLSRGASAATWCAAAHTTCGARPLHAERLHATPRPLSLHRPWRHLPPILLACPCTSPQLFYSFFKTLVGKEVVVELKNGALGPSAAAAPAPPPSHAAEVVGCADCLGGCADLAIRGTLHSVDQYLNVKLLGISVEDVANFPHMSSVKNCFVRGSVIKYVQLPASEVDTELLQDATRREAQQQKDKGGGR